MRIAVLYNAVPEGATLEDQDLLVQVDAVAAALRSLGHEPISLACSLDLAAMRENLRRLEPAVVFNLVESLAEADSLVYLPHAVLDVLGLPYTGNHTEAMFLTTHKLLAKQWLRHAGLPTPPWMEIEGDEWGGHSCLPPGGQECLPHQETTPSCPSWIIKGVWDQASRGMEDDAVVHGAAVDAIRARLRQRAARTGSPCFAEQFIEGHEFNLSVLTGPHGPEVLPPAEIDFSAFPPGKPRIVGHRAKWQADSFEYHNTPRHFDFAPAERPLLENLRTLARRCWALFGLRGWARVDFRVDMAGQPWILEVNANPCLSPDAGFAAALQQAGIPFEEAIRRILEEAC